MARFDPDLSNALFDTLHDWNQYLKHIPRHELEVSE